MLPIGHRSGWLEVIGEDLETPKQKVCKRPYYFCKCHFCGNDKQYTGAPISIREDKLNGVLTISCIKCSYKARQLEGNKEHTDAVAVGKVYGDFEVLERLGYLTKSHMCYWKCRCKNCGRIKAIASDHLKKEQSTCECAAASKNERFIAKLCYAIDADTKWNEEKFRDENGRLHIIDFALLQNKVWVEVDGEGHFQDVELWSNGSCQERQRRDRIKDAYAEAHGVTMVRIPWWEVFSYDVGKLLKEIENTVIRNQKRIQREM